MNKVTFALAVLCLAGCSRQTAHRAYAAEVRAAHQTADAAESPAQKAAAKDALESAFQRGDEPGAAAAIRQDLADRAARLELELGHAAEALRWTQRGLAIDDAPSVLRANLLITEAEALAAQGQRAEARQALFAALEINQALLQVELDTEEPR
jgi:hypothetical protein